MCLFLTSGGLMSLHRPVTGGYLNKPPAKPNLWQRLSVCVVRRCALTRGDLGGSRTQSFGLVRHPQPELQRFTRSPLSPWKWSKLSSDSGVQQLQAPFWEQMQKQPGLRFCSLELINMGEKVGPYYIPLTKFEVIWCHSECPEGKTIINHYKLLK